MIQRYSRGYLVGKKWFDKLKEEKLYGCLGQIEERMMKTKEDAVVLIQYRYRKHLKIKREKARKKAAAQAAAQKKKRRW